jgi:hypothetical protein
MKGSFWFILHNFNTINNFEVNWVGLRLPFFLIMLQSAKTQYDLNTPEIVANNFALNRTNHLTICFEKKNVSRKNKTQDEKPWQIRAGQKNL